MEADPATVAQLVYDHRGSIVGYLNEQANAFEVSGRKEFATLLRAQASNVAIQMDVKQGRRGIASPVDAVILEVCAAFGGTNLAEVKAPHNQREAACRARTTAMWVAKKRLPDWTDDQLATAFQCKDRSTVSKAIKRADELRAGDGEYRRVTDNLLDALRVVRCEHCQSEIVPAAIGGK